MPDTAALPLHVLLVSDKIGEGDVFGGALDALRLELDALGVVVGLARTADEARAVVGSDPRVCVAVIDVEMGDSGTEAFSLVDFVRSRSDELSIFLMASRERLDAIPTAVVRESEGFVYLLEDTPDWIAGRLRDAALRFREEVAPPMFAGLVSFARTHEYSWHTPGHEGGTAFRKSPVGQAFVDFFGEQMVRC